jgi:ubiquinol-cytochrome c reductase cytochrome c1 subunit
MLTEAAMQGRSMRGLMVLLVAFAVTGSVAASEVAEGAEGHGAPAGVNWQAWTAGNEVKDTKSLQRGASNFVNYCLACHSLKYMRYERMANDLEIPLEQLRASLIPTDAKPTDYMLSTFPKADAEVWFGKQPPDLSLVARARGTDWTYRFLKGFYIDKSKATGTNNLVLDGASMPAVLSDLEGVKAAVFSEHAAAGGAHGGGPAVERFETIAAGRMTPEQFDGFVRDTVNFLDYVGEPSQVQRRSIGIWVVLFLLVFTAFAWMLKKEYWKDVR